jgi:hypothetical protein
VVAGFHTEVFPIRAGAMFRLEAMAVKVERCNGKDKPFKRAVFDAVDDPGLRMGLLFIDLRDEIGIEIKKSMVSQAASISAW